MASSLKAPEPFSFSSPNLAAEWKMWRRQFEYYLLATRKAETDEEVLVGVLITLLGVEGFKIFDTFVFATAGDDKKIKPVLDKFDSHFEPLKSEVFERFKFLRRHQQPGESFDSWIVCLRGMLKGCNYGTSVESVLRDQVVLGIADTQTREKLLFEKSLDLAKACDIVRACEASRAQLTQMTSDLTICRPDDSVNRLAEKGVKKSSSAGEGARPKTFSGDAAQQLVDCKGCGRQHARGRCPDQNVTCFSCGVNGHFSRRCPSRRQQAGSRVPIGASASSMGGTPAQKGTKMQLHSMEGVPSEGTEEHSVEEYVFHELRHERRAAATVSEWSETLSVDGVSITVKLDFGASCNVLPQEVFHRLPTRRQRLRPGPRLRRYGAKNGYLSVLGVHTAKVVVKGTVHIVDFVVVNEPGQPSILGLPSCQSLDLIRRVNSIQSVSRPPVPAVVTEFLDVFTGLGKLPIEHVIKLSTGSNAVDPVVSPAGRIPFRLEEPVYRKLDQMVADGIIAPVSEPTDWVSRMMVVSKPDGDVRICIDPSSLNKAVLRQHYSIPTVEQLFAKIGKAKFFCSLDAAQGFYQILLSEESSYLCTMATPRGRYRFLRMPFGLKSAPEVYLHTMSELFGDLTGVITYFDDFLVTGESMEELQTNLRQVLTRCRQHNLKLQLKKCKFFLKEVPWLGHVIGDGVVKVDPSKVEAIVNMPEPTDKAALVRLLGMATYLDKFCPNLAGLTRSLRDLLKESSAWVWEEPQRAAWVKLKEAMSSLPALRRFDLDLPAVLSVDASPTGLGAVLLQNGQPVAYSSTSLTPTQQRYCQLEKELLAVQFGLMRFKQYVFGQQVTVESDHKPLVGLLDKQVADCSPRIQRMRLQLQSFDFCPVYKPGKELFIADTLSRAHLPVLFTDDATEGCQEQVHAVLDHVIPLQDTRSRYSRATEEDPALKIVKEMLLTDWPDKKSHCPLPARPYWNVHHSLSEVGGIILYGERLVVPVSLRREVMDGIHFGHFGEVKCVRRAKSSVYWSGCDDQIRNMVASCPSCQENRHNNPA
ncbi:uncharacterized protein K02A2.6-like [Daphnia magna]|uniref:uncharacterized protein K02A2.6-like n=1 Tax=Daphnia magna TaxID=35525 RepID=UPI001E1BDE6F|nr:uncharacterized protein K02A2.6-like [Daphnia magna]